MINDRISRRKKHIAAGLALAALLGGTGAVTGATAGSAARVEASLTDATAEPAGVFVAVSPIRVLDTRPAPQGPIGVGASGTLAANATMDVALAGDGLAIPSNATSALLNVTIDEDTTVQSYLTVWPSGEARPLTSANNALPGLVASNSILAKLGTNGRISIYNQQGAVNVVIDLVGYLVPLSEADGPGAELTSGNGAPAATVGSDGDFYIDTTDNVLYGPKTGGVFPSPGIALGGAEGAASAYGAAPFNIALALLDPVTIGFDTAGPADGSVSRTDVDTFAVSDDGLYTVDYHLDFNLAIPGSVTVEVDGVQQGPARAITAVTVGIADSVLVDAEAGDTIELVFTPTAIGANLGLTGASITVEQATNT